MVIVTSGKVVIGRDIYPTGAAICDLTAAQEKKLIGMGLASKPGDVPGALPDADERIVPIAKGPSKAELQARCRELGISDRGNKAELQERIDEAENADREDWDDEIEADDGGEEEPPELTAEVPR